MREYNVKYYPNLRYPPSACSFLRKDIEDNYRKLWQRYNTTVTKRSRLCLLSEPKHLRSIYREECAIPIVNKKRIEIVDITDRAANTRTQQLALPKPRNLVELRKREIFKQFEDVRKSEVNRLYLKSVLSMYSRLMNITPEEEPNTPKKWDRKTKKHIMARIRKLAKPKTDHSTKGFVLNKKRSKKKQLQSNPERLKKLCQPKKYIESEPTKWVLTEKAKKYKPTARLELMSKPKIYTDMGNEDAFKVPENALKYKATPRIIGLAEPHKAPINAEFVVKKNPFKIPQSALRAKCSARTKKLSVPKKYDNIHIKANPFKISPAALKAKPTPRILILATPKSRKYR